MDAIGAARGRFATNALQINPGKMTIRGAGNARSSEPVCRIYEPLMIHRIRDSLLAYLQRGSLRRRVAYSLAIVRIILVPVIFLAIYYLFVMGRIVDRIVNKDAPSATLAQQASIQMLVARRAERTFLLFHDDASVKSVDESLDNVEKILGQIRTLQPAELDQVARALSAAGMYSQEFHSFVTAEADSKSSAASEIQSVVADYEKSLDTLIRNQKNLNKKRIIDELRARAASFDDQITKTIQATAPALLDVTTDLRSSSEEVLQILSKLEEQNWNAVQEDHREARALLNRAEWTLGIVSGLTFLLSVWISFILPEQVVLPLVKLKRAVDRAITDGHESDSNVRAEGELGELADSIRRLLARIYESKTVRKH
jgi:CHASE3 domain sensor protein